METLAVHGVAGLDTQTGALHQPLYLSTTYQRDDDGEYSRGYIYSRLGNPNRKTLEDTLAKLEHGACGLCFASGLAAFSAMLQALETGDHVIFPHDMYFGGKHLVQYNWQRWGLTWTSVDMTEPDNVRDALRPNTKMIWMETPSNPLITIIDLQAIADIARAAGALTVCDSTLGTPVLQNPLTLGIDVVMHSTTKYINGHSDVLGGALVFAQDGPVAERVRVIQEQGGAVPSPFDCMLIMRGLQTMPLRVREQCATALKLSHYLHDHPAIDNVYYPGLTSHPQHELAKRQMSAYGAMASILIHGDEKDAFEMMSRLKVFVQATSLGGTHSKIEHRFSVEGEQTQAAPNLLRVSFGIEHIDDLREDLEQALAGFND
jgi:cystathionine gamma-synthase